MKFLLEIETDGDKITFAEEVLGTLSFVRKVTLVAEENRKTLADIFGKFNWDVDGLEYQKAVRDEWC
ncbi:MAG: hypothetical protein LBQ73_07695 [Tannerellaceae bacterium]|jgi:hypothetical protein|nr:hypothetical protein [Tannerellaceae bacterium]